MNFAPAFLSYSLRFVFLLSCLVTNVAAQDAPVSEREQAAPSPISPVIRQAPVDAVVVFNTNGKQQIHLPGWRLEDLDEIREMLLKKRQSPNPPYVLQEISATGTVVDNRVEAAIRIVLTTVADRSVLVPLGLKEGVLPLQEAPQAIPYRYAGQGSMELMADPLTGQYLALLHPPTIGVARVGNLPPMPANPAPLELPLDNRNELRHEILLTAWFPLTHIGNEESRLTVSFPQAATSQFVLAVPIADAVATIAQGAMLDTTESPDEKSTRFKVLGLKPEFEMAWRKQKAERVDERPVLSVDDALILARLDEKTTTYEVSLPVRSRTVGFERVGIKYPKEMILDRESAERYAALGGYTFRQLESPASGDGPSLEIQLPRRTVGPVNVRFKTLRQDEVGATGDRRDLGGFEVLEAERQTGQLAAFIPPNMRATWNPIQGIRRVEPGSLGLEGQTGGMPPDGADACFEFFTQPFLLQGTMVLPQTRINVKPEYQIQVDQRRLHLSARFSYVVYGTTEKLAIHLPGWQWNHEIGPPGIVDSIGVTQDENGLLTIPLRTPQEGEFEIELKASRPLAALPEAAMEEKKRRLVIPLPQPQADWTQTGPVVVAAANNVEVTPLDDLNDVVAGEETPRPNTAPASPQRTTGLTRRSRRMLTTTMDIPERQQEPLFYETEPGEPVFVADIQIHRRKIEATMQTEIRLRAPDDFVAQVVAYDISYVPVEQVAFLIPDSLLAAGTLTARLGGRTLELRDAPPVPGSAVLENWSKKIIQLPEPMFQFQVVFNYTIPPVVIEHDQTTAFGLAFLRPVDVPVSEHQINMTVPTGFQVVLDKDAQQFWTRVDSSVSLSDTGFRSTQSPSRIALWISTGERDSLGTTVVDCAWLQTWLTGSIRVDRASFLVTSERCDRVLIRLPVEAARGRVFVYRDRQPIHVDVSSRGDLTVPLEDQQGRPVLIEIEYRISPFEMPHQLVELELPHFDVGEETLVRNEYWQVILPQNRHILGVPGGWTPEYTWAWTKGFFWGRVPVLAPEDVGFEGNVAEINSIPTESNQYLFSSLHPPSNVTLCILTRSRIVLFSSGLALVIGLILIYFPKTRFPGSLFGLGVALLAMLLYRPAPVVLMLQASSFGVLLSLGTLYIHRILYQKEQWIVPKAQVWNDASHPSEVYSVIMDDDSRRKSSAVPTEDGVSE